MIEIKAKSGTDGITYTADMEGRGDDIIREAVGIVKGLYEGFENDANMKDAFLMLTSKYILSKLKEKYAELEALDTENKGGENLA